MPIPHLPAEILDHVVDHLHDTKYALRYCCLVSKSWIPRARTHIFANIKFHTAEDLESWKQTFPDPSTSPAHYAKTLFVGSSEVVTAVGGEAGDWIRGFSRVVQLKVGSRGSFADTPAISFVPFHGFSPVTKSLRVIIPHLPSSPIFDLILSFPLLEDLSLIVHEAPADNGDGHREDEMSTATQPSSSPMFTGSLELLLRGGMKLVAHRLLSLPGGIHFRKLTLTWIHKEDLLMVMALVEGCSHTLESLRIICSILGKSILHLRSRRYSLLLPGQSGPAPLDLSKTTKLKDVVFQLRSWNVEWIATTLKTITPKHRDLRQITIRIPYYLTLTDAKQTIGEAICGQWSDLDCLLVLLWESRSVRLKVVCAVVRGIEVCIGLLLPEATKREIVDLV